MMTTSYMIVDSDSGGSASRSFPASPLPTLSLGASRSPGVALTDDNWSGFASQINQKYWKTRLRKPFRYPCTGDYSRPEYIVTQTNRGPEWDDVSAIGYFP